MLEILPILPKFLSFNYTIEIFFSSTIPFYVNFKNYRLYCVNIIKILLKLCLNIKLIFFRQFNSFNNAELLPLKFM